MINFFKSITKCFKRRIFILSLFVFLLALFLRTYNLENIYVFNFDEEYQATYAWTEVKDPHPIWIGVSSSFLDFYLGPYFTYFTAILLAISHGDPMLTAYFAAVLGSITAVAVFLLGYKLFNLTAGFVASLLYATLPLFVFFDQKYWNTMFTPLITILLLLTMVLVKKNAWFWVLFAALFGAVLETHLEPAPLLLIGIFYFIWGGYYKNFKLTLTCLLVFLILYWPLIVFDINHNYSNLLIFTRFGKGVSESKVAFDPYAKFKTLFDSMGRFWYLKSGNPNADEINFGCTSLSVKPEFSFIDKYAKRTYANPALLILTIGLVVYFLWIAFKGKNKSVKMLGLFVIVALLAFMAFPGGSSEYYTLSFLVLLSFVVGVVIAQSRGRLRWFMLGVTVFAAVLGVNTVLHVSDEFSLGPKKVIIRKVMELIGQEPFAIEGRGVCHDYEGWRFLFKVYARTPIQSYTDKNLGWLYPDEIDKSKTPVYTVILAEDRIPLKEDLSMLPSIREGGYRAYVRKN